ncbi:MAG: DUF167 domain-containing protein [Syntrophaceae bacterium]|nr:DUF167 domain-containing protein [Syntrophaceae bacterium]
MSIPLTETKSGLMLKVRVLPRSSRTEASGVQDGALKLKIMAPPVEGQANEACLRFLAETLGIRKSQITLVTGQTSKTKTFALSGVDRRELEHRLAELLGERKP